MPTTEVTDHRVLGKGLAVTSTTSRLLCILRCFQLTAHLFIVVMSSLFTGAATSTAGGVPCVFEGHLTTDKNWYGYVANISVITTARMTFEFTYAADRCCQNVLFYTEDQTSIISARMNCWQKEYLLRPEDDQILRLTPRFSWSGCHMTHPNGLPTYHCVGGRSFTVDTMSSLLSGFGQPAGPPGSRPSAWYIAVSNCAALNGLDLRYRLVVYGHVGDCPSPDDPTVSSVAGQSVRSSLLVQHDATSAGRLTISGDGTTSCLLRGSINSTSPWHGFIANMSLARGGGFRFRFQFAASTLHSSSSPSALRVLLYRQQDLVKLSAEQMCWQKNAAIRQRNEKDQVMTLSAGESQNGCVSNHNDEHVSCQGERRYDEPLRLYVAVSDCHSVHGVQLDYELDVYGVMNPEELCSTASTPQANIRRVNASSQHQDLLCRLCRRCLQCN